VSFRLAILREDTASSFSATFAGRTSHELGPSFLALPPDISVHISDYDYDRHTDTHAHTTLEPEVTTTTATVPPLVYLYILGKFYLKKLS